MEVDKNTQAVYNNDPGDSVRPSFGSEAQVAKNYYKRYVDFIVEHIKGPSAKILDLGCGEGWSTLHLKEMGWEAYGVDLQDGPIEACGVDPELPYSKGDGENIPFEDNSFDIVAMHQVMGHIPHPELGLKECIRVLNKGGRLIVVGPNLLSFAYVGYWACKHTLRCLKQGKLWEKRTPDMPRHPGGDTMPEAWKYTFLFFLMTVKKLFGEKPVVFKMREPDLKPPFTSNNDTCYLSNPMDLVNWANNREDIKVIKFYRGHGLKNRLSWFLKAGMWVVLEKVES